jgi:WD40 repeat protein
VRFELSSPYVYILLMKSHQSDRSSDETVKIWDIAARQCVSTLTDQSGDVWGVSWRPIPGAGAGALVSSGDDGRLRWWRSAGAGAATGA